MRNRLILGAALALIACVAQAALTLSNRERAVELLKSTPPCCVVDARNDFQRELSPLANAVVWSKNPVIVPSGMVVVIATDDKTALKVARDIRKRFKAKHVLAIKGGIDTWRDMLAAAQEPGMPATFIIPHNTCEQGAPLQTLRSNKR